MVVAPAGGGPLAPSLGGVPTLVGVLALGGVLTLGGVPALGGALSLAGEFSLAGDGGACGSSVTVSGRSSRCGSTSAQEKIEELRHSEIKALSAPRRAKTVKLQLTLGAALGATPRSGTRVRQARLRCDPCFRDGWVSHDLNCGHLNPLRALLQGPAITSNKQNQASATIKI